MSLAKSGISLILVQQVHLCTDICGGRLVLVTASPAVERANSLHTSTPLRSDDANEHGNLASIRRLFSTILSCVTFAQRTKKQRRYHPNMTN